MFKRFCKKRRIIFQEGLVPGIKKIASSSSAAAGEDDKQKHESRRQVLVKRRKQLKLEVRLKKKRELRLVSFFIALTILTNSVEIHIAGFPNYGWNQSLNILLSGG